MCEHKGLFSQTMGGKKKKEFKIQLIHWICYKGGMLRPLSRQTIWRKRLNISDANRII
jgi:hypothetical protein